MSPQLQVCFSLPEWLMNFETACPPAAATEERMRLVLQAARLNLEHETGGPFAAGIFETDSGRLLALGVNRVVSGGMSMLHAEMVATSLAQQRLGHYDLGARGMPAHELVTSTEPCTMCLGNTCWSGVTRVVSAARDADARKLGFDEGPKPANWIKELQQRGIEVQDGVLREQAVTILQHYQQQGGLIYNARKNG